MRHVAIIGAGVAGLTVAFRLARRGERVSVFEASERLGGQLHSEHSDGFLIEHGAEGFVAGSEALAELAGALGIASELRGQLVLDSCHFDGQRLARLEPGEAGRLLGFQVGVRALGRGIQSFQRGMSALVEALHAQLPASVSLRQGSPVRSLQPAAGGLRLGLHDGVAEHCDAVVVATRAADAARLLEPGWGAPARALSDSETLSSVTVSLAYARERVAHPLDATGFVVADAAQLEGFRACTFASSKLPGRAPAQQVLLRLFFRPSAEQLLGGSDADWVARAERCAARALGQLGASERAWVSRWQDALPVFDDAHRARVLALEASLAGSGVVLAGAAFHGSGIDGAVRSAEAAARAL
ncbi:MAG TPA: FAD-dependent oxidoreductase [Polyangiaceae bacterium]|jgi:oxygen-dependent protoporphyrinogen oxidase|nr:FAD-dependent oxidoreductase [Polyangiaceae bacterium]